MNLDGTLSRARDRAQSLMADECTITRPGDVTGQDEATGKRTRATGEQIYWGRCRVQVGDVAEAGPEAGEHRWTVQRLTVSLPVDTGTGVRVGDVVTITVARHDTDLEGRRFRVAGLHHKTHATARRLHCEEVTG